LKHLHSIKLIHRDIKPENIVIFKDGSVKICDLENVKELIGSTQTPYLGTLYYRSPEFESGKYNESVDIWSFGMTLLHISTQIPIKNLYELRDIEKKLGLISNEILKEAVESCLMIDPMDRISIDHLFKFFEISFWVNFEDYLKFSNFTFENDQLIKKYCSNDSVCWEIKKKFCLIPTIEDPSLKELIYRFILNGERFEEERNRLMSKYEFETMNPHLIFLFYRNKNFVHGEWSKNFKPEFLLDYFEDINSLEYLNSMGVVHFYGCGVEVDFQKAFEFFQKSANKGHSDAQFNLGVCFQYGIGVTLDLEKAIEWFEKSSQQGHSDAQFNLGNCYRNGLGVEVNLKESFKWFEQSAKKGNSVAQLNLANFYRNRFGVEKDLEKAIEWYMESADNGDPDAQCILGNCFQKGIGVEINLRKAIKWFKKSADQGNSLAKQMLDKIF
jgi:hypothetical protein